MNNRLDQQWEIQTRNHRFKRVDKYLRTELNSQNDYYEEIKLRIKSENKCYFAVHKVFKSKLLSEKSKERLYNIVSVGPDILYACETWPTAKKDK